MNTRSQFNEILDFICNKRKINKNFFIFLIESSFLFSAKKNLGQDIDIEVNYDSDLKDIDIFHFKKIVKNVLVGINDITVLEIFELDNSFTSLNIGEEVGIIIDFDYCSRLVIKDAKFFLLNVINKIDKISHNKKICNIGELAYGKIVKFIGKKSCN